MSRKLNKKVTWLLQEKYDWDENTMTTLNKAEKEFVNYLKQNKDLFNEEEVKLIENKTDEYIISVFKTFNIQEFVFQTDNGSVRVFNNGDCTQFEFV